MPQSDSFTDRGALRAMFNQYLQVSDRKDNLSWETITAKDGLPHNWIYDLFQDSRGRIWVGTWGGGLGKFESDEWQIFRIKDGLCSNEVTCIREDQQGRIWMATDNGLNFLDNGQILKAGLSGKSLLNMSFDQDGALWVGCWRAARSGGGLYRYDGQAWQSFNDQTDMPGLEILKVFADSKGRIWIGTYEHGMGAGVGCYDGRNWQTYTVKEGLANNCVYSMFEDPSGNIWFGTIGGLSVFDGKEWHTITKSDGLIDNRVYCMLIDTNKKMWFGTENGISRFDGNSWISFTKRDGLVENLTRAIIEADDGALWFGAYPYQTGLGGISIGRYEDEGSLTDQLLDLLPGPLDSKKLGPGGDPQAD